MMITLSKMCVDPLCFQECGDDCLDLNMKTLKSEEKREQLKLLDWNI